MTKTFQLETQDKLLPFLEKVYQPIIYFYFAHRLDWEVLRFEIDKTENFKAFLVKGKW